MSEKLTRHHILSRERADGTWHEDNIVRLDRKTHDAVHCLFGNDLPIEILRRVTDTYRTAIDSQAYNMINGVLVQVEGILEAYNPHCYNGTKLKDYLNNKK